MRRPALPLTARRCVGVERRRTSTTNCDRSRFRKTFARRSSPDRVAADAAQLLQVPQTRGQVGGARRRHQRRAVAGVQDDAMAVHDAFKTVHRRIRSHAERRFPKGASRWQPGCAVTRSVTNTRSFAAMLGSERASCSGPSGLRR